MSDDDELDPMSIEGFDSRLVNVETILPDLFDMYELRAAGGPYYWAAVEHDQAVKLWGELGKFATWLDGRYLTNLPATGCRAAGTDTPSPSKNSPRSWSPTGPPTTLAPPKPAQRSSTGTNAHSGQHSTRSNFAPASPDAATAMNTANPTPAQPLSACPTSTCATSTRTSSVAERNMPVHSGSQNQAELSQRRDGAPARSQWLSERPGRSQRRPRGAPANRLRQ